jgi:biopolymer transport protein TolQ
MNPTTGGEVAAVGLGTTLHDMTPWGMFLQADFLVKLVMIGLIVASFWSWAIIFEKVRRFRRLKAQADAFEEQFWSGNSLDELYDRVGQRPEHPMALLFSAAMREWRRAVERPREALGPGLAERISKVMRVALAREMEEVERYLGYLATVGSTAPFIGLFGTVWGIMRSFIGIANSQNTSLAVVAPGIAEALFATALGLVAAIPAMIAYNKFVSDAEGFANRLEGFADEFSAILSRQIDERRGA